MHEHKEVSKTELQSTCLLTWLSACYTELRPRAGTSNFNVACQTDTKQKAHTACVQAFSPAAQGTGTVAFEDYSVSAQPYSTHFQSLAASRTAIPLAANLPGI